MEIVIEGIYVHHILRIIYVLKYQMEISPFSRVETYIFSTLDRRKTKVIGKEPY